MRWLAFGPNAEHEGALCVDIRPVAGVVADIRALRFPDEEFDGIECHHVLEHLLPEEAQQAVRELWRVLKPWGILEVSVPDMARCCARVLEGKLDVLENIYSPNSDPVQQHRWGYTTASFCELLEGAGFVGMELLQRTEPHDLRLRARKREA